MITKMPKYMKWAKITSLLASGLITLWILIVFWGWLTPATFWQKVAGFLLSLAGGGVIFVFLHFLFMMSIGLLIARRMKKKMMQGFQMPQQPEQLEELNEGEPGEGSGDEDEEGTMFQ